MSVAKSKSDLDTQIQNLKHAFYVGLAAYELLGTDEVMTLLNKPPHDQVIKNWLAHPNRRTTEREQFLKLLFRAMIKEPYETIKAYCNDTNQLALFESQSWYEFARQIRNAMSHNYRFKFSPYDISNRLPLTWRGKTIDASMDGQEMTLNFLGPVDVWYFVEDMQTFVNSSALK